MAGGFASWVSQLLGSTTAAVTDDEPPLYPSDDSIVYASDDNRCSNSDDDWRPPEPDETVAALPPGYAKADLLGGDPVRTAAMMSKILGLGICTPRP